MSKELILSAIAWWGAHQYDTINDCPIYDGEPEFVTLAKKEFVEKYKYSKCPICGSEDVELITRDESFEFKGQMCTVHGCEKLVCNHCEESFFTDAGSTKLFEQLSSRD